MMNKTWIISFIVVAGLIVSGFFFFRAKPAIVNYPPPNNTIVAFGDSLVQGIGATEGNDFVSKLSSLVGLPITNLGVSGNTTSDGLARLNQVTELKPGIVILLLGGNDYLKRVPVEQTFANLNQMITTLQENGAVVVLLGVRGGLLSDNFDKHFENLSKRGVLFVPNVLDGLINNRELMSDQVHPNDRGYEIIAAKIYPVLKKALP